MSAGERKHEAHELPRLSLAVKLGLSIFVAVGWLLFLSAWVAGAFAAGWAINLSVLVGLGELLAGFRETSSEGFWILFGLHAVSLVILNSVTQWLSRRMAMPRGFRTAIQVAGWGLAALDLFLWLLLPVIGLARALLAPVLLLETAGLLALVLLQLEEMWVYVRWKGSEEPVHVVIVGGGFGGLYTALSLDGVLGYHDDLRITLIDRKNYFLFPPLLPSVATGAIESRQVTNPFRRIFEATNVRFQKRTVTKIDLGARQLHACVGDDDEQRSEVMDFDYLVVAPGAQTNTFNVPGADTHAFYMRELGDAISVRNHVIDCFEQAAHERHLEHRLELLRFVIVGAGPTGVELASELQDLIQHVLLRRYPEIDPDEVEVVLVQSGDRVLPGFHDMVAERTKQQLLDLEVRLVLGTRAVEVGPTHVKLKSGELLETRTVAWCTGVKPAKVIESMGLALNRGKVGVSPDLQIPDHPGVFVVGDVAHCEWKGQGLPALAQVAFQQGAQTGPNIARLMRGRSIKPFDDFDYGSLVCVGEHFAVVDLLGIRFSGFFAWIVWRSLYLFKLVGFGNRVRVLLDWTLDLLLERSISQIWTSRTEGETSPG